MKFFDIQNAREFCEIILRCGGEVHQIQNDGTEQDMKVTAMQLIRSGAVDHLENIHEIDLKIEQPGDAHRLMRYALGMGRERICA